jgi:hypothetical protein
VGYAWLAAVVLQRQNARFAVVDSNTLAAIQSVCAAAVAVVASLTTVWTARHRITMAPPVNGLPNGALIESPEDAKG